MTPELMIIATFLVVAVAIFCIGRLLMGTRNEPEVGRPRPLALGRLTLSFAHVIPTSKQKREKLRGQLVKAGYYGRHAVDEFLSVRNAAIIAWITLILCYVAFIMNPLQDLQPAIIAAVVGFIVVFSLPTVFLGSQSRNRIGRIKHALPDALDMVNMLVVGGLPLNRAIERVSHEMNSSHPDIACELAIINHQASAGSLNQALEQFGTRVDEPDVVALATLVQHADQLGGNVSGAFQDYADGVRRARRQRAEERGNKATVKLLFPVIFFLTPPIYILLLGPAVLEMRDFLVRQNQVGGVLNQDSQISATRQVESARQSGDQAQ